MEIKLPVIKEIIQVAKCSVPLDRRLNDLLMEFDQTHRKKFGKAVGKQQVLLIMLEHGKPHIVGLIAAMNELPDIK